MRRARALIPFFVAFLAANRADADTPWGYFPTGRLFGTDVVRPEGAARACSFRDPICVHAPTSVPDELVFSVLAEAEHALRSLRGVARLPAPMPDDGLGGGDELDVYLVDDRAPTYQVGIEIPASIPVDRAPAFVRISAAVSSGCARKTAIHRGVATALLAAVDSGESGGTIASFASYLAWQSSGCTAQILAAVDDAQKHPERASARAGEVDDENASPLLPFYLDAAFGDGAWGSILTALFYGGSQKTAAPETRYRNDQRDLIDTLDRVAKSKEKRVADVLGDFAAARAFFGDREDGAHILESRVFGTFGRVRFDDVFAYPALPKRLAFTPLEPTGSVYVWVDLAGAPKDAAIAMHAEWESPITMKWAAVRVGAQGEELSRIELTREPGIHEVERNILQLDGAVGVILAGVSVGEIGLAMPFHVDEAPYEPHAGTVYVLVPKAP